MSTKHGNGASIALRCEAGSWVPEQRKIRPWPKPTTIGLQNCAPAFTAMAVVASAGILLTVGLLRLADRMGPETGDIIAFPATRVPSASTTSFPARRANAVDTMSCILDVQARQKAGGSLVVESSQFEPSRIFRVHWAGLRASDGRDDCSGSADLLLNSNQISALIFAAGGTDVATQN